jgi:transposase-like protein
MTQAHPHPQTLLEAVRHFSDLTVCHDYMVNVKWPDGKVICPKCGGDHIGEIKSRRMFQCKAKGCRKQFSAKVGTIFEDSPLGLDKWFVGVWCIANAKNGISSHELGRALGVTQKSAWHMLHRIRLAMNTGSFKKIQGESEADESFIGGAAKNMHREVRRRKVKTHGPSHKITVHGILNRDEGRVNCEVVPTHSKPVLQKRIREHVEPGSSLYTDSLKSYEGLEREYIHGIVDHSKECVNGRIHTNGLENFWSLLKRTLKGPYVSVAPFHLQRYVTEQTFRFNARKGNDATRFLSALLGVVGQRLTYATLTSANAEYR